MLDGGVNIPVVSLIAVSLIVVSVVVESVMVESVMPVSAIVVLVMLFGQTAHGDLDDGETLDGTVVSGFGPLLAFVEGDCSRCLFFAGRPARLVATYTHGTSRLSQREHVGLSLVQPIFESAHALQLLRIFGGPGAGLVRGFMFGVLGGILHRHRKGVTKIVRCSLFAHLTYTCGCPVAVDQQPTVKPQILSPSVRSVG